MGLFRKPNVERAPAAAEVLFFADGTAAVSWHGAPEILVRSPGIYLDWAVSKDNNRRAERFLGGVREFLDDGGLEEGDRIEDSQPLVIANTGDEDGTAKAETTIIFTDTMLCKPSFRPRRAIVELMYPTFWALWNEMVLRVGADEPETVESLVDDLLSQIDYYAAHGVAALRGGRAHLHAAQLGASRRLKAEVAEFARLTVEDFEELSEDEQDAITDRYSDRQLAITDALNNPRVTAYIEELYERWAELWETPKNPIFQGDEGWSDLARAIVNRVQRETALRQAIVNLDAEVPEPLDEERESAENGLSLRVMAAGYLWRDVERGDNTSTFGPARFAVEFMSEKDSNPGSTRVEKLDRAVMWMMRSFEPFGFDPPGEDGVNGDIVLELAFPSTLQLVTDGITDLSSAELARLAPVFRKDFRAGVALREAEPYFPLSS
jgi:hypothetical protein